MLFSEITNQYLQIKKQQVTAQYYQNLNYCISHYLAPHFNKTPINKINKGHIQKIITQQIEVKNFYTAKRLLTILSYIFRVAIAFDCCQNDPTYGLNVLIPKTPTKHFAAPITPEGIGRILSLLDTDTSYSFVASALKLLPFVFVRPFDLASAKWADINWKRKEWWFMLNKSKKPHITPLATQVITKLERLKIYSGHHTFLFPHRYKKNDHIHVHSISHRMRQIGISPTEATVHGFRATARTLLDETLGIRADFIEHQLGHSVKEPTRRAYNRTTYLPERHEMMQTWADSLDQWKKAYQNQN